MKVVSFTLTCVIEDKTDLVDLCVGIEEGLTRSYFFQDEVSKYRLDTVDTRLVDCPDPVDDDDSFDRWWQRAAEVLGIER